MTMRCGSGPSDVHLVDDGLAAEAVEAVAAYALLAVTLRDGVGGGFFGHGVVEDGVEAGEVGDGGELSHGFADECEGFGIVKGREGGGGVELAEYGGGDEDVILNLRAGVDDAVSDGVEREGLSGEDAVKDGGDGFGGRG